MRQTYRDTARPYQGGRNQLPPANCYLDCYPTVTRSREAACDNGFPMLSVALASGLWGNSMGVIGMAAEIVGGMVGMGYVCHRIEQVMLARNGYDTRDFFRPIAGPTAAEPPPTPIDIKRLLISEEQERLMAQSFIDNPTAFWLDPNLWGDDPDWKARLFPPKTEPLVGSVMRMRGHIDKRKEAEHEAIMLKNGIQSPKLHFRSTMPCPHVNVGEIPQRWPTDWRKKCLDCGVELAGHVPDGDYKHGACPSCAAPCEQFTFHGDWFYSCTRATCEKYWQGWGNHGKQIVSSLQENWHYKRLDTPDEYDNELPPPPRSR
jgi:hypothetical protein